MVSTALKPLKTIQRQVVDSIEYWVAINGGARTSQAQLGKSRGPCKAEVPLGFECSIGVVTG